MGEKVTTTSNDRGANIARLLSSLYPKMVSVDGVDRYLGRYLVGVLPGERGVRDTGVFFVCDPKTFEPLDLCEDVYEQIVAEAEQSGLAPRPYVVLSRRCLLVTDDVVWTHISAREVDEGRWLT